MSEVIAFEFGQANYLVFVRLLSHDFDHNAFCNNDVTMQ